MPGPPFPTKVVIQSEDGLRVANVEQPPGSPSGALAVMMQDQYSNSIQQRLMIRRDDFQLAEDTVPGSWSIEVSEPHSLVAGDWIILRNFTWYMQAQVFSALNGIILLDRPVDHVFDAIGTQTLVGDVNLAVDGVLSPQVAVVEPPTGATWDLTRILFTMLSHGHISAERFGGIASLDKGLTIRKYTSGEYHNEMTLKSNADLRLEMFDVTYDIQAPLDMYGLAARRTWAGQDKTGVTIRLAPGDRLEAIIPDDLTGLVSLFLNVQGHVVE